MTWVVISHLFTYISMLMTDIFCFFHPCWSHWPLPKSQLKTRNSRISLQWSLLREPSLRMLSLSEIFTIKPHVWSKKQKQKQGFNYKFYHSHFIMTAKCSPGLVGPLWQFSGAHTGILLYIRWLLGCSYVLPLYIHFTKDSWWSQDFDMVSGKSVFSPLQTRRAYKVF